MHSLLPHSLHHFWIAMAFVRHPTSAVAALVLLLVATAVFRLFRR